MVEISWTGLVAMILASFQIISLLCWRKSQIFNGKVYILRVAASLVSSLLLVCLLMYLPKFYPILLILGVAGATEVLLLVTGQVTWHDDISEEKSSTRTICSGVPSTGQVEEREVTERREEKEAKAAKEEQETREARELREASQRAELQEMKEKMQQYQEHEKKYIQEISQLNQKIFCLTTLADKRNFEASYSIPTACQNFLINQMQNRRTDSSAVKNSAGGPGEHEKAAGTSSDNPLRNVDSLQQAPGGNTRPQSTGGGEVSEFQHLMRWNSFKHS